MNRVGEFALAGFVCALIGTGLYHAFRHEQLRAAHTLVEAPWTAEGTSWPQMITDQVSLELLRLCAHDIACMKEQAPGLVKASTTSDMDAQDVAQLALFSVDKAAGNGESGQ